MVHPLEGKGVQVVQGVQGAQGVQEGRGVWCAAAQGAAAQGAQPQEVLGQDGHAVEVSGTHLSLSGLLEDARDLPSIEKRKLVIWQFSSKVVLGALGAAARCAATHGAAPQEGADAQGAVAQGAAAQLEAAHGAAARGAAVKGDAAQGAAAGGAAALGDWMIGWEKAWKTI